MKTPPIISIVFENSRSDRAERSQIRTLMPINCTGVTKADMSPLGQSLPSDEEKEPPISPSNSHR